MRCSRDLANDPHKADWKDYCPNEPTLAALPPLKSDLTGKAMTREKNGRHSKAA
jgi:hypothetical protein